MSDGAPETLHQAELRFFCVVTASLSHQINNVLTIISELNGLSEDLLALGRAGEAPFDRLEGTTARINDNLQRCVEYLRVLNRFAHSADQEKATCDVKELVLLLQATTRRFFDLRKASLVVELPERDVVVLTQPFPLLHLLFRAVWAALSAAEDKGTVRLSLEDLQDRISIRLSTVGSQSVGLPRDPDLQTLILACRTLGAALLPAGEQISFPMQILIPRDIAHSLELEAR